MNKNVYIIAGPNGAGKTTFAREFLPRYAECRNFVNADLIAEGVSPLFPEQAAFRAGRLMLAEIDLLVKRNLDFGFETTLSGRAHVNLIRDLKKHSYNIHIFFLWLPRVELALARVAGRVMMGGHDVPEPIVRRRFKRSLSNFFHHYRVLADSWVLFDNSGTPTIIAFQKHGRPRIIRQELYDELVSQYES